MERVIEAFRRLQEHGGEADGREVVGEVVPEAEGEEYLSLRRPSLVPGLFSLASTLGFIGTLMRNPKRDTLCRQKGAGAQSKGEMDKASEKTAAAGGGAPAMASESLLATSAAAAVVTTTNETKWALDPQPTLSSAAVAPAVASESQPDPALAAVSALEGRKKSEESQAAEVLAIPSSSGDSQAPEVASLALKSATATASALDLKGQVEILSEVGAALEAEAAAWKSLQPKRKIARIGLGLLPIFAWVPMAVLLTFAHS